jgi:hypothetical protein
MATWKVETIAIEIKHNVREGLAMQLEKLTATWTTEYRKTQIVGIMQSN